MLLSLLLVAVDFIKIVRSLLDTPFFPLFSGRWRMENGEYCRRLRSALCCVAGFWVLVLGSLNGVKCGEGGEGVGMV